MNLGGLPISIPHHLVVPSSALPAPPHRRPSPLTLTSQREVQRSLCCRSPAESVSVPFSSSLLRYSPPLTFPCCFSGGSFHLHLGSPVHVGAPASGLTSVPSRCHSRLQGRPRCDSRMGSSTPTAPFPASCASWPLAHRWHLAQSPQTKLSDGCPLTPLRPASSPHPMSNSVTARPPGSRRAWQSLLTSSIQQGSGAWSFYFLSLL